MTRSILLRLAVAASLLFAAGCKREQIRVYVAPADVAAGKTAPEEAPPDKSDEPQIGWQLPEGWRETQVSSPMILANFKVPSTTGGEASASIAHLASLKGREPALVNMWREQVGLGPMDDAAAAKALIPTTVAGAAGQSFEVTGTNGEKPLRILTAVLHRGEWSWFFKLAGDETTVEAHKAEFLEFVKTIRFLGEENTPSPQAAASTPEPPSAPAEKTLPQPKWSVPAGWTTLTPGQMQIAKFAVPEQNGAKAEVSVSVFPSDTGGNLANVNRWRAQMGLPATDEAGLATCTQALEGGALLVDLTSEQRQLVGAIVPRDGRWWFYKMLGDAPAVTAAKDALVQFIKTAP